MIKKIITATKILRKQMCCNHQKGETLSNFHGDYINVISRKHIYRSAYRCRLCNKICFSEELDKNCNVINWNGAANLGTLQSKLLRRINNGK